MPVVKPVKLDRLMNAYEFFKTLPSKQIDMDDVVEKCDVENNNCGTIACGMGWLAIAKPISGMRLEWQESSGPVRGVWRQTGLYMRGKQVSYLQAAKRIFNIDGDTAAYLFGPTPDAYLPPSDRKQRDQRKVVEYKGLKRRTMQNHKSELLARIETVLAYNGVRV